MNVFKKAKIDDKRIEEEEEDSKRGKKKPRMDIDS